MRILIETIPHKQQRYPTVGDWFFDDKGDLTIQVSALGDWREEALVAVHELVEVLLCKHQGVGQQEVDTFDLQYEAKRIEGDESEPGDSPDAPYKKQHCLATGVERVLAAEFGIDWGQYEDRLNSL
jgi:hypothetical protein